MIFLKYSSKMRHKSVCRQGSGCRAPALLTAAFVAVSLLFVQSPSWAAKQAVSGWQISKTSGDVRYRLSDDSGTPWIQAKAGSVITTRVRFETGADGRITLIRDGDKIGMSPNSRILLPSAEESRKVTTIFQSVGIMLYKVQRRARALLVGGKRVGRFEVRTPYLVTMVKGTTFAVSTDNSGAAVNLIEGILDVSTSDGNVVTQILGGQIASVATATKGAISVIKINGTGQKVFRSQPAVEAKAASGKALSTKKGVRALAFNNRSQEGKKAILSSLAAYRTVDKSTRKGTSKLNRASKSGSSAKVTVIALAKTVKPKNKSSGKDNVRLTNISKGNAGGSSLQSVSANLGGGNAGGGSLQSVGASLGGGNAGGGSLQSVSASLGGGNAGGGSLQSVSASLGGGNAGGGSLQSVSASLGGGNAGGGSANANANSNASKPNKGKSGK
jgi:hypothetical protein